MVDLIADVEIEKPLVHKCSVRWFIGGLPSKHTLPSNCYTDTYHSASNTDRNTNAGFYSDALCEREGNPMAELGPVGTRHPPKGNRGIP